MNKIKNKQEEEITLKWLNDFKSMLAIHIEDDSAKGHLGVNSCTSMIEDLEKQLAIYNKNKNSEGIVEDINILEEYKKYCLNKNITFKYDDKVNPYDDTTLFCPAGMQQFKSLFKDINHTGTIANVQSCIRMNDFDEIGDSTHLLYFNMMGLFSFREMTIDKAIDFWMEFLTVNLGLIIDYVTIHSDRSEWKNHYTKWNVEVRINDSDCIWTDGEIGGYCTEFFINDVEIGNIVNPLDNCIDVGFGLERLQMFVNDKQVNKEDTLKETILKIIDSGYKPSNLKQGYVLRKLLRELYNINVNNTIDHPYFEEEILRQQKIVAKYEKLKNKHSDKPKEWWFDTHGINLDDFKTNENI